MIQVHADGKSATCYESWTRFETIDWQKRSMACAVKQAFLLRAGRLTVFKTNVADFFG